MENKGISTSQALRYLREVGYNEVDTQDAYLFTNVLHRLWGFKLWMLEFALILEIVQRKRPEAISIFIFISFQTVIDGFGDWLSHDLSKSLKRRLKVAARIKRDGRWQLIPSRVIVPGDVISLKSGDMAPADVILTSGAVEVDQSAFTGNPSPVYRMSGSIILSNTIIEHGEAIGTIQNTGPRTRFGQASDIDSVRIHNAPNNIERSVSSVQQILAGIVVVTLTFLASVGFWYVGETVEPIPYFLVLASVIVPIDVPELSENLITILTRWLAKNGVLLTDSSALYGIAAIDTLCVDRSSILTTHSSLDKIVTFNNAKEDEILGWAASTCDITSSSSLEKAVCREVSKRKITAPKVAKRLSFDPSSRQSGAILQSGTRIVWGSPSSIAFFVGPEAIPELFYELLDSLSLYGSQVLAIAMQHEGQRFAIQGLISFHAQIEENSRSLISSLKDLGLKIIMVTGDTMLATRANVSKTSIGYRVSEGREGIADPELFQAFADLYPEEKVDIINSLKRKGHIVGVVGRGINDVAALSSADIGIAVDSASSIAKLFSGFILGTPGLAGILTAVELGRKVSQRFSTYITLEFVSVLQLSFFLTTCFIATGHILLPLVGLSFIGLTGCIMRVAIATDNTYVPRLPQEWRVRFVFRVSSLLALAWLGLGLSLVYVATQYLKLPIESIQTLCFVYFLFTYLLTVAITRTPRISWTLPPGYLLLITMLCSGIFAVSISCFGWGLRPADFRITISLVGIIMIVGIVLDWIKSRVLSKST